MATIATTIKMYDGVSSTMSTVQRSLEKTVSSFENIKVASDGAIEVNKISKAAEKYNDFGVSVNKCSSGFDTAKGKVKGYGKAVLEAIANTIDFKEVLSKIGDAFKPEELLEKSDDYAMRQYSIEFMVDEDNASNALKNIEASAKAARVSVEDMFNTWKGINELDAMGDDYQKEIEFAELMTKAFKTIPEADVQGKMDELLSIMSDGIVEASEINKNIGDDLFGNIDWGDLFANNQANTSDFIKTLLDNAGAIEEAYANVPILFSEIKQSLADTFNGAFAPLLNEISEAVNGDMFSSLVDVFVILCGYLFEVLGVVANIASFFVDNWSIIEPVVFGIVGAIIAFTAAMAILDIVMKTSTITWIILAVIALITVIIVVIVWISKWVKKMGGLQNVIRIAAAYIRIAWHKLAISVLEAIKSVIEFCKELDLKVYDMACSIVGWILDMGVKVVEGFEMMVNKVIDHVNWLIDQLNKLPFFGWIKHLDHIEISDPVQEWVDQQKDAMEKGGDAIAGAYDKVLGKVDSAIAKQKNMLAEAQADLGVAMSLTNQETSDSNNAITTWFDPNNPAGGEPLYTDPNDLKQKLNLDNESGGGKGAAQDTADNTEAMKDSMEQSAEELKWLRDAAEAEAINRFTTAEIKVEMNNQNSINSEADIDGIVSALSEQVEQAMIASANGVYA